MGQVSAPPERDAWNATRWERRQGHYESWFIRANHPTRALAFWIRYTIFAPAADPGRAEGELWMAWFDGERGTSVAVRSALPAADCRFSADGLEVRIGGARLDNEGASGAVGSGGHRARWSLRLTGGAPPLLLMPRSSYQRRFPKAKVLVPRPACAFHGTLEVDEEQIDVGGWLGSQNHNWGPAHTDRYAWSQVAGFDGRQDAFLECSSARLRMGPWLTPWLTLAVLRIGNEELAFNSIVRSPLARVRLNGARWTFRVSNPEASLWVAVGAAAERFVRLDYRNPPGGTKTCWNSKIGWCDVVLRRRNGSTTNLRTGNRAALELLDLPVHAG
jgi:hypothetical protein